LDNKGRLRDGKHDDVTGGFTSFVAAKDGLQITYHDQHGDELFAAPSVPPRDLAGLGLGKGRGK
jgi:hypothetical protein